MGRTGQKVEFSSWYFFFLKLHPDLGWKVDISIFFTEQKFPHPHPPKSILKCLKYFVLTFFNQNETFWHSWIQMFHFSLLNWVKTFNVGSVWYCPPSSNGASCLHCLLWTRLPGWTMSPIMHHDHGMPMMHFGVSPRGDTTMDHERCSSNRDLSP